MTIPSFDLVRPHSVREACQRLLELGEDTRPIAGGTTLVTLMKQRALHFTHLVDLQFIPGMDGIENAGGQIRIGALATLRSIETSPLVREQFPVVADAFRRIGSVRIPSGRPRMLWRTFTSNTNPCLSSVMWLKPSGRMPRSFTKSFGRPGPSPIWLT